MELPSNIQQFCRIQLEWMQPPLIEYALARAPLTWSKAANFSFLCGVLVGPAGFFLVLWTENLLFTGLLILLCAMSSAGAILTIARLRRSQLQLGEWLAVWGMVLSVLWMILYSLLLLFGLLLD
jgi:hypothetical protein